MILGHLGLTLLAVRYVFRDPAMDMRFVLAGSLLPDLVDKPLGAVLFNEQLGSDRLAAHAIVFPVVMLFVVLGITRRGSPARKGLIGVVIGALLHLVLDGAWSDPEAFWWPLFGLGFPERVDSAIGPLVQRVLTDPWLWAQEAAGLAYLAYLWRRWLRHPEQWADFRTSGRIPLTGP